MTEPDVDLTPRPAEHVDGTSRNRPRVVLGLVAVVALVTAAFLLRPDDDVEVAVDEETTTTSPTTSSTTAPPEPLVVPVPIPLGAPDDGKDSVGLPVSVDPASGLVDGQQVTVTGSGFPPGESVGVVMCTREAGRDWGGRGADACNIGHFVQGTADADGTAVVEFSVRRIQTLDGAEVDCASEAGRCLVGMGLLSDYDQSGGALVDFDPSEALPDPPTVELAETEGIVDGETVALEVTGLYPHSTVYLNECVDTGDRCTQIAEVRADGDGSFDGGVRLWRTFGTFLDVTTDLSPNVDCAEVPCRLQIHGEAPAGRVLPTVDLTFDRTRGARTPPEARLAEPGPFGPGDPIGIEVDDAPPGWYVDALVCTRDGQACAGGGGQPVDADRSARFDLWFDAAAMGSPDPCATGCLVHVSLYPASPLDGEPPPLFPPPIPVTISG